MPRINFPLFSFLPVSLLLVAMPLLAANADDAKSDAAKLDAVEVTAQSARGYHADYSQLDTFGSFGGAALQDTPAAISVLTREHLNDRQSRTLSEVARSDASLGDYYAPVGYYQNVAIRGFALDLATGYRFNGLSMAGEQRLSLEDKERVEILKGLGGLQAGVLSPGGLINYVSKRPDEVRNATLGTDSHGSRYVALDLGHWLTPNFGVRLNAAHEGIHSHVEHADGRRNFLSLAADWKVTPDMTLRLDSNYQTSSQRSVSGYQLLGGTVIPENPSRTQILGYQPWQSPVDNDAGNTSLRLDYRLADGWNAQVSAGHSRTVIDDYVAFVYGCSYAAQCASGEAPPWYFAPNGDFDIYDYRSPDDTRINDEMRAVVQGAIGEGSISHEITFGASAYRRSIDRRAYVYDYIGTGNIYDPEPPAFAPSTHETGASVRRLTSWQRSVFALDRIHLGDHWQVLVGGRHVELDERAYSSSGKPRRNTQFSRTLPQAAVMWQPSTRLTTYLSYSENLALGGEAPNWTSNSGTFLPARVARQNEAGVKLAWSDALNLGAALYHVRQPYHFAQPDDTAAGFTMVEQGEETRQGLELSAAGKLSDTLQMVASVNVIRARAKNTGTPAYEGHQQINVPSERAAVYLDYRLPVAPDLSLLAGWRYASANVASADGSIQVPAYHVFDAGLRYDVRWNDREVTWRLAVDNLFDRFYWSDTGSSRGDQFLIPGAPRLARLSVSFGF